MSSVRSPSLIKESVMTGESSSGEPGSPHLNTKLSRGSTSRNSPPVGYSSPVSSLTITYRYVPPTRTSKETDSVLTPNGRNHCASSDSSVQARHTSSRSEERRVGEECRVRLV